MVSIHYTPIPDHGLQTVEFIISTLINKYLTITALLKIASILTTMLSCVLLQAAKYPNYTIPQNIFYHVYTNSATV